jgi:uncharacterized membrane protein YgcG
MKNFNHKIITNLVLSSIFFYLFSSEAIAAEASSSVNVAFRDALMNGMGEVFNVLLKGEGFGSVINSLFIVCAAIAIFQAVDSHGGKDSFLLEWSKLVFYMYVVLAILGKVSVTNVLPLPQYALDPLPGTDGVATLDVAVYRIAQREFNSIADDIGKDFNEDSLTRAADAAVKVSFGMLKGSINCDSTQPATYGSCFNSYITESKADEAAREAEAERKRKESAAGSSGISLNPGDMVMKAVATFMASATEVIITFLVKAALWGLLILRTMVNYLLLFSSVFITLISFFFIKIFSPFLLLNSYRGRVINAFKIPISTALYGLMSSIVVAMSTAVLMALNSATKTVVVGRLTTGGFPVSEMLQVMMGNFAVIVIILLFQIVAMSKIPRWSKDLMDLSINTFVDLSESLVQTAQSFIGPAIGASIPWVGGAGEALFNKFASAKKTYSNKKDEGESSGSAFGSAMKDSFGFSRKEQDSPKGFANFSGINSSQGYSSGGLGGGGSNGGGSSSGGSGGGGSSGGGSSGGASGSSGDGAKSIGINKKTEDKKGVGSILYSASKSMGKTAVSALGRIAAGDEMMSVLSNAGSETKSTLGVALGEGREYIGNVLEERARNKELERENLSKFSELRDSSNFDLGEGGVSGLESKIKSGTETEEDYRKISDFSSLSEEQKNAIMGSEDKQKMMKLQEDRISALSEKIKSGKSGENDYEEIFRLKKSTGLSDSANNKLTGMTASKDYKNWEDITREKANRAAADMFTYGENGVTDVNFSKAGTFIDMSKRGLIDQNNIINDEDRKNLLKIKIKEKTKATISEIGQKLSNKLDRLKSSDDVEDREVKIIKTEQDIASYKEKVGLMNLNYLIEETEGNMASHREAIINLYSKLDRLEGKDREDVKMEIEKKTSLISECELAIKEAKKEINKIKGTN